eukprot:scaffold3300_cov97-Isochrysis_galbana.AAC.3
MTRQLPSPRTPDGPLPLAGPTNPARGESDLPTSRTSSHPGAPSLLPIRAHGCASPGSEGSSMPSDRAEAHSPTDDMRGRSSSSTTGASCSIKCAYAHRPDRQHAAERSPQIMVTPPQTSRPIRTHPTVSRPPTPGRADTGAPEKCTASMGSSSSKDSRPAPSHTTRSAAASALTSWDDNAVAISTST